MRIRINVCMYAQLRIIFCSQVGNYRYIWKTSHWGKLWGLSVPPCLVLGLYILVLLLLLDVSTHCSHTQACQITCVRGAQHLSKVMFYRFRDKIYLPQSPSLSCLVCSWVNAAFCQGEWGIPSQVLMLSTKILRIWPVIYAFHANPGHGVADFWAPPGDGTQQRVIKTQGGCDCHKSCSYEIHCTLSHIW